MLAVFDRIAGGALAKASNGIGADSLWIDMRDPSTDDLRLVEAALGIEIPERDSLKEIETSSRLFSAGDATFMTANVLVQVASKAPLMTDITLILTPRAVVSLRHADSHAISQFAQRATRPGSSLEKPMDLLVALIETIVYRQADLVEHLQADVEDLNSEIFGEREGRGIRRRYADGLKDIGRLGAVAGRARESLISISRLTSYLAAIAPEKGADEGHRARIKAIGRDVTALMEHVDFLAAKITFLLDATLGFIGIEQNNVIKILSIAAGVFLPPTLIASIYGMNFERMPELAAPWGYPIVLGVMLVTALVPVAYFRWKRWL